MNKIFIVEDDKILREELAVLLEGYGYLCEMSDNFKTILDDILASQANLILLDINLPYVDGYHICREIRKVSDIPIIIVTSRNTDMDELMSMNLGADDFITKPYNTQILLAHISAILRRTVQVKSSDFYDYKGIRIFPNQSKIVRDNKEIELTKNELRILIFLVKNQGKIVSRVDLMDELWQSDEFVDDNTLTVNVNRLRKKLREIGADDLIQTKRGQGYIL